MKRFLPYILLVLACIPVLWALVKPGFYVSHDGEFNLIRLMHFYKALSSGQFPVRWVNDLNFGYGSPVFTFFYPLTYYLGSVIHFFGPDFGASLKILIAIATVSSVLMFYIFLKRHWGTNGSLLGALLYLFVPYRLELMYVTGSFGVILSLFFFPLILFAIDNIVNHKYKYLSLLAVGVFGLLTSHNVTALLLLPVVVGYSVVSSLTTKNGLKASFYIILGLALGIGMAAFFIIPALTETGLVYLSQGVVVNFRDHFPTLKQLIYSKWGYFYSVAGTDDGMSFQIGLGQWIVFGLSGLFLIYDLFKKKTKDHPIWLVALFLFVFSFSIFMMLPISRFIWDKISLLAQIQFPWRLLVVIVISTPFLAAYSVDRKHGNILIILILAVTFWANRNYLRTWETLRYSDSSYISRVSLYNGSTDIAWETRPISARLKPTWLASGLINKTSNILIRDVSKNDRGDISLTVDATKSGDIVLSRFFYPTWKANVDGVKTMVSSSGDNGLIKLTVPQGNHHLNIYYERTGVEKIADFISTMSIIVLCLYTISFRDKIFK